MKKLVLILCAVSVQASADTLFSDLGTGGSVYTAGPGAVIQGTSGDNIAQARPFTVSGSGMFNVTQIDLGIVYDLSPHTFTASIWTDNSDNPGTELGAWNLTTNEQSGSCCLLTTQSGITGVTVTGGVKYWLVAAPVTSNDGGKVEWELNSQGQNSEQLGALNGEAWIHDGTGQATAFDVLGTAAVSPTPEPGSLLLLGTSIAGMLGWIGLRRRRAHQ